MRDILIFVRQQLSAASLAAGSEYNDGYVDALEEVQEFVEDLMWEEGETA
jgi:hypothetical protein